MNKREAGFTLIELLVVISVIALLLSILMPSLGRVKEQAQAVVCRSNLKQWGLVFSLYASDNNSSFPQNIAGDGMTNYDAYWCHATMGYYDMAKFRFCPSCKRNMERVGELMSTGESRMAYGMTLKNWGPFALEDTVTPANWWDEFPEGSYGMNEWCSNPPSDAGDLWGADINLTWRKMDNVRSPGNVPLFLDCKLTDTYPRADQNRLSLEPQEPDKYWEDIAHMAYLVDPMEMVCMDRHNETINSVFVDMSARKVGLKELWTLKWNPRYDTQNDLTRPGYIWPEWMAGFKDYSN